LYEIRYVSSLLLIFMGSMDCLTTVIGTLFFGTVEVNPLISGLVSTNLAMFVVVKLAVTTFVGMIFVLAQRTLLQSENKYSPSFRIANNILRGAFVGITFFLVVVVVNNVLVILKTM
jgi:hypothetical protein